MLCPECCRPALVWLIAFSLASLAQQVARARFFEGPNVSPLEIFKDRGFIAEDHFIVSEDRHKLKLTRARNPLIDHVHNNRTPLLLIHGILESFNVFVANSFHVRPRDFGDVRLDRMSLEEALERYAHEPSANSLAMFALNHGHEVWLLSRRGFPGSRSMLNVAMTGKIGEKSRTRGPVRSFISGWKGLADLRQYGLSFNKKFWNFSLDEQAEFDVPNAVNLILERSGKRQVSVVGHSAGGAITMMALSMFPELNDKINSLILYSPAFVLGHGDIFKRYVPYKGLFGHFRGPLPLLIQTEPFLGLAGLVCNKTVMKITVCRNLFDSILGESKLEAPMRSEFVNTLFYASSSLVMEQLLQNADRGGPMHKYNYGPQGNLRVYGQDEEPAYNLSRVTLERMSFYEAGSDFMVTPEDVKATERMRTGPFRRHYIRPPFNHQGYFYHNHVAQLVVIPSLREIHEFSERGAL